MANKYANGKIYAIMSSQTDKMYIGSTIIPLNERFNIHKNKNNKCNSKEILQYADSYIILLEDFPCNSRKELHRQEGFYILNNDCVNKYVSGRTKKEYDKQNKDNKKQYYQNNKERKQEYYQNNKQKILQRKKEKYNINNQSSFDNPVLL